MQGFLSFSKAGVGSAEQDTPQGDHAVYQPWETIQTNLKSAVPPAKIFSEQTKTTSILRDLLNADFNRIVVNDKNIFNSTKSYIQKIAPDKADIVSFYHNGSPIFDSFGVTKQVKAAFGKTVNLPSGAYLIVEPTEALHVWRAPCNQISRQQHTPWH